MIAVDTSALMAIVLGEPEAGACIAALEDEDEILISPGTLAEALIVSERRNVDAEVTSITDRLGFAIVTTTAAAARREQPFAAGPGNWRDRPVTDLQDRGSTVTQSSGRPARRRPAT